MKKTLTPAFAASQNYSGAPLTGAGEKEGAYNFKDASPRYAA